MSDARARVILRRCYNETRRVTSFALVRNPIEVRLSAWLWLRKYGARSLRHLGFEEFITTGSFADPRRAGLLALPQSTWLSPQARIQSCFHISATAARHRCSTSFVGITQASARCRARTCSPLVTRSTVRS